MKIYSEFLGITAVIVLGVLGTTAYANLALTDVHPMVQFGNLPDFNETAEVTFKLVDYHNITYQNYTVNVGFATYGGFKVVGTEPTRVETMSDGNKRYLYLAPAVIDKINGNTELRVNITAVKEGVFPFELIHIVWPIGTYESHSSISHYRIEDGQWTQVVNVDEKQLLPAPNNTELIASGMNDIDKPLASILTASCTVSITHPTDGRVVVVKAPCVEGIVEEPVYEIAGSSEFNNLHALNMRLNEMGFSSYTPRFTHVESNVNVTGASTPTTTLSGTLYYTPDVEFGVVPPQGSTVEPASRVEICAIDANAGLLYYSNGKVACMHTNAMGNFVMDVVWSGSNTIEPRYLTGGYGSKSFVYYCFYWGDNPPPFKDWNKIVDPNKCNNNGYVAVITPNSIGNVIVDGTVADVNTAIAIVDALEDGYMRFGDSIPSLKVLWPLHTKKSPECTSSCYVYPLDRIFLHDDDGKNRFTVIHEFGHHLTEYLYQST